MFSTKPCGVCDTSAVFLIDVASTGDTSVDVASIEDTSILQGSLHNSLEMIQIGMS